MKKLTSQQKAKLAGIVVLVLVLLAAANYLAGAMLFAFFHENPTKAEFLTIEHAYFATSDPNVLEKIKVSAFISLLICGVAPVALFMRVRPKGSDLYGQARFADKKDIQKEKLDAEKGVVLGKYKNELLRLGGFEFVLLAAPTRTGKGVGFCVPNLLQFTESAVVLDIKGENYNLTSEFRRRYMGNEIVYFNPFSENTKRWNPLSYVSQDPRFRANDLMAIATIIYPVNEKDPFWSDAAKNLFVGLGLLVLETPELPKTIGEILRQGSGKGKPIEEYVSHVLAVRAASPNPLSNSCIDSLNRFLNSGETALKGIVATFSATLTPFANQVIDKATSGDDFDLRDVRKKKMTIYLNIPAGEILQAGFILNLFFSQLINENVKELPEQNPALKYQCLLLLDEFTAMGKVAIIAKGVGYMAGYNMRLAIIIQDKTQLEAVYGKEDAHNIVSNMGAVIYFTPAQISEAEEYSKMIGNITVLSDSIQHAKGTLFGLKGDSGDSRTESFQSRAVMLPQELLSMSRDNQLVVRSGIPVIMADKIRYFADEYFKERFNAVPMQTVMIGNEKRSVPIPAKMPSGDWESYFESVKNSDYYAKQTATSATPAANVKAVTPPPAIDDHYSIIAQVTPPNAPKFEVPTLPNEFIPFYELHALLRAPASANRLTAHSADQYALCIARYWASVHTPEKSNDSKRLVILDLSPQDGSFAWQLISRLAEYLREKQSDLSVLRYIACFDQASDYADLERNPYIGELKQYGIFRCVTRDSFLEEGDEELMGQAVMVLADGVFGRLQQELYGLQHEEILRIMARPTPALAAGVNQVALEYQWSAFSEEAADNYVAAILESYRSSGQSVATLIPTEALACLQKIRAITGDRFALIATDHAISKDSEVFANAYATPNQLTIPSPEMRVNYHALVRYFELIGGQAEAQNNGDGSLGLCLAWSNATQIDSEVFDTLRKKNDLGRIDLHARVIETLDTDRAALADLLKALDSSNFDPDLFSRLYSKLDAADWNLSPANVAQWHTLLDRVWLNYLPTTTCHELCNMISSIALRVRHYELARSSAATGILYDPADADGHVLQAWCDVQCGRLTSAMEHVSRALEAASGHAQAHVLHSVIQERIDHYKYAPWYAIDLAQVNDLSLQPLCEYHAERLFEQYRDPQIASAVLLPAFKQAPEMTEWITTESQNPYHANCAIHHQAHGVIGYIGLHCDAESGYLRVWLGQEHQGKAYGVACATAMLGMLKKCGITHIYAAANPNPPYAVTALNKLGFVPTGAQATTPHSAFKIMYLGALRSEKEIEAALQKLSSSVKLPFTLATSQSETVPT